MPLHAQVTAAISGTVADLSGRRIGRHGDREEHRNRRQQNSDDRFRGTLRVLSLPLGPQEVKAEKAGFKSALRTGVDLVVGQEAVVNLQLEVGELSSK
jgi:hypothetical protein